MPSNKEVAIKISNLTKAFGSLVAVNNISLQIYKGEILGFLGPNGAGKTTSINIISGLLSPTEGDIAIFGKISNKNILKKRIGICPQENIYWPKLTCSEQLHFVGKMYDIPNSILNNRTSELLEFMALNSKRNTFASKLSGGMKRRLNICLALIHDPEILILDEPEAGLDPQSRILVRNYIKSLANDKTIILTTHNMDEADRLSDRVAIIDHGKLLMIDSPENLKKSIGKGDVLEISIATREKIKIRKIVEKMNALCKNIQVQDNTLLIRSTKIIEILPSLTSITKQYKTKISKLIIRKNSLEDVFIQLTGRKLRQ